MYEIMDCGNKDPHPSHFFAVENGLVCGCKGIEPPPVIHKKISTKSFSNLKVHDPNKKAKDKIDILSLMRPDWLNGSGSHSRQKNN